MKLLQERLQTDAAMVFFGPHPPFKNFVGLRLELDEACVGLLWKAHFKKAAKQQETKQKQKSQKVLAVKVSIVLA